MNYMPLAQDICMKPAALHFQLKVECLTVLCRGKLGQLVKDLLRCLKHLKHSSEALNINF
jgi:hypothetical protein